MARAHVDPEAWARKVKIRKRTAIILMAVVLLTTCTVWLLKNHILPARRYAEAEEALAQGNIQEAVDRFSLLSGYRDAWERALELASSKQPDDSFCQLLRTVELGDTVSFGHYEQDGNQDNGPEPVRWIVLADDAGRVLLWSEQVLELMPYHEEEEDITWADCTLRTWLNDTFYQTAFTPEERLLISLTEVVNVDNTASGADGGRDTQDHVCILSFPELLTFALYNPNLREICAKPTASAVSRAGTGSIRENASWWLRTPGINQACVTYCDMGGNPLHTTNADRKGMGVRPLLWVFAPGRVQWQPEE